MMQFEFPKYNLDAEFDEDTGFPFDDERLNSAPTDPSSTQVPPTTSSSSRPFGGSRTDDNRLRFEDHLRDIAARYPEFAEHIRPTGGGSARARFPRERIRRDPWGRDDFDDFGSGFNIPPEFAESSRFARPREFYPPNTQTYSTSPPYQSESRPPVYPQSTPSPHSGPKPPPTQTSCPAPSKPHNIAPSGIHQSNTVDLGQVQPPSTQGAAEGGGEGRGQRSMSAPPADGAAAAAGAKRYVSSIQIPVLQQGAAINNNNQQQAPADMGTSNSNPKQPAPPQTAPNRPHEYVIPIHIEGRDEPIIPKQQPPLNQNQPLFNAMKDQFRQQQEQVQKEQQQKFCEQKLADDQLPKAQVIKPTSLEMIQLIQKDVSELMSRVEKFLGQPRDKDYIYLDEMLTRNLLKLDNIETEGKDTIRRARREAIKCIEGCISILEAKANANAAILAIQDKSTNVAENSNLGLQKSSSGPKNAENIVVAESNPVKKMENRERTPEVSKT